MRLNNGQWNVTKNDLFLRNKSKTLTHRHRAQRVYLFIYYTFVGGGAVITVAVAFHSLLFAIGVFGDQFNELLVSYRATATAAAAAPFAILHVYDYKFVARGDVFNIHCMLNFLFCLKKHHSAVGFLFTQCVLFQLSRRQIIVIKL